MQSRSEGGRVGIMVSHGPSCPGRSPHSQGEGQAGQCSSPSVRYLVLGQDRGCPPPLEPPAAPGALGRLLLQAGAGLSSCGGSLPGLPSVTPNAIGVGLGREAVVLIPTTPEVRLLPSGCSQVVPLEVVCALAAQR